MSVSKLEPLPAHFDVSARRRRAGRRLLWSLIGLFALTLIGVPLVAYLGWVIKSKAALRQELAIIATANEPLTTSELTAYYKVPADQRDITQVWLAALAPFDGWVQNLVKLPDVIEYELPVLGQAWRDEASIRTLLATTSSAIDALHAAAELPGEVSYPHDFSHGAAMLMTEIEQMYSADKALRLEFHVLARDREVAGVQRNLLTRLRMADTLAREPIPMALRSRQHLHALALRDLLQFVSFHPALSDEVLSDLQQLVRALQYRTYWPRALIGERAHIYQAFHYRFRDQNEMYSAVDGKPIATTDDISRVGRPEDCATAIRLLTELVEASKQSTASLLDACVKMDAEVDGLQSGNQLHRWRYRQTVIVLGYIGKMTASAASAEAYRDLTDIALTVRRYERAHGHPPADLALLVPDFLPALPVDPFDGLPLRKQTEAGVLTLYSVGPDRADDGGLCNIPPLEPDIAVTIPLSQAAR